MGRDARSALAAPMAALLTLILLVSAAPVAAITTTWTGASPVSNLWSDAANWDVRVPVNFDRVRFSAVGGTSVLDIPGLRLDSVDMTGFTGTLNLLAPLQVTSDFIVDGTLDMSGGTLVVAGRLRVNGIALTSGAAINVGGDLVINGSVSGSQASITVTGSVDGGTGASLVMGSGTLRAGGNARLENFSSVSFASDGTLLIGGPLISLGPSGVALGNLQVQHLAPTDLMTLQRSGGPPVTLGGQLTITRGILDVACGLGVTGTTTVEAEGELRNGSAAGMGWRFLGRVVANSGKVRVTAAACTLSFAPGGIGDLDLNGTALLEIRGSTELGRMRLQQDGIVGGARWVLDHEPTATVTVEASEVQDAEARPGPIITTGSIDAGNNVGWVFGPKTCRWTGSSPGSSLWSDDANWSPSRPVSGDSVRFEAVAGSSFADIAGLLLAALDMTGYAGALALQQSLSVAGDVRVERTLALGGGSLVVGSDLDVAGALEMEHGTLTVTGGSLIERTVSGLEGATAQFAGPVTVGPGAEFNAPEVCAFGGGVEIQNAGTLRSATPAASLEFGGDVVVQPGGRLHVDGANSDLRFGAGRTLRIHTGALLEIAGQPTGLAWLRKDGPSGGARWFIDVRPGSTTTIESVRVQDSDASPGEPAIAHDSEDEGNNLNWIFGPTGAGVDPLPGSLAATLSPNPFHAGATVRLAIPRAVLLRVRIWDVRGRLVRMLVDGRVERGWLSIPWDGRGDRGRPLKSGLYFWRIDAGSEVLTRTLARVR